MSYTFFRITAPDGEHPRNWAQRMWDTYGFDYDTTRFGIDEVIAWAIDSDDELRAALEEDGIEYTTFEIQDLDRFFELDKL